MKTILNRRFFITVFFFLICGILNAQTINKTDSLGRKQGPWKKYAGDTLKYEGTFINDKPDGQFKYFYPGGKIKALTVYADSGRKAQTVMYFSNGMKNAEGLFVDKKKDGLWIYYGTNGKKISEENYKTGIREGVWKYYYDNGKISKTENYKNNMLEGECLEFYADSVVKTKSVYQQNKLNGKFQFFYSSGKILYTGIYKNDRKSGEWMFFNENGLGSRKLTYNNGALAKEELLVPVKGSAGNWLVVGDIAFCFSDKDGCHVKKNSGEEILSTVTLNELEQLLDQFNFFRISPDFLISRWSLKDRKLFSKENPVIVLNPDPGRPVKVHPDKLEGFMSWASLMKYE